MLSPPANLGLLQRTSCSGRFFPSQPPSRDAEQITRIYHDNTAGIRIGMRDSPADREALKVS